MPFPFELDAIRAIHDHRIPLLDAFFKFLNFFDRKEFFFLLIPIVWSIAGWKNSLKFFSLLVANAMINQGLKGFFEMARPLQIDPSLALIPGKITGYSFPSGAAQTSMLLGSMLIAYGKTKWKWPVALTYILLISFSRIYLGAHFFSDIIVGWLVGFCLFILFFYSHVKIENSLKKVNHYVLLALSQLFLLSLFFSYHSLSIIAGMGMVLGSFFIYKIPIQECKLAVSLVQIFQMFIAVLGTALCNKLGKVLFPNLAFIRFFLIGLWCSLGIAISNSLLLKLKNRSD